MKEIKNMKVCYDGTLLMPKSYSAMNEEEMMYLEGGGEVPPIPVNPYMLNKDYCMVMARNYTEATGLSEKRIAQEIYAHAVLNILGISLEVVDAINNIPFASSVSSYLIEHGSKIDLGGDTWYEVAIFKAIWQVGESYR